MIYVTRTPFSIVRRTGGTRARASFDGVYKHVNNCISVFETAGPVIAIRDKSSARCWFRLRVLGPRYLSAAGHDGKRRFPLQTLHKCVQRRWEITGKWSALVNAGINVNESYNEREGEKRLIFAECILVRKRKLTHAEFISYTLSTRTRHPVDYTITHRPSQ